MICVCEPEADSVRTGNQRTDGPRNAGESAPCQGSSAQPRVLGSEAGEGWKNLPAPHAPAVLQAVGFPEAACGPDRR